MKFNKLFILLSIISIGASAQVMNVRKWRVTERDSLDKAIEFYDEKLYLKALPLFGGVLQNHPKEEFLKYSYAKCALYRADKHEDSYKYFAEVYAKNKKIPDIQYDMALAAHYNYKFDEASEYASQYASGKSIDAEGKKNTEILKRYIANAKIYLANPGNAIVKNMGSTINTEYDEYAPVITADESRLIFTYAGIKSIGGKQNDSLKKDSFGDYLEDIYLTDKVKGEFQAPIGLDSLNTNAPEAAISLSNDGERLFVYQDIGDGHGDIYQSTLNGDKYALPEKLQGEVNSYAWDGHCSLSPDGNLLYFSSERVGGFGGRDIYRATLQADSTWANIVNLGDSVNTALDDDAPFIHPDGVTLFFSSKGRTSMGGYDIFKSVMRLADTTFRYSENLGYPINSPTDDIYFVMAANGTTGYYSSAKKDGKGLKDIYSVETNFSGNKSGVHLVKGLTKFQDVPVAANIKIEISSKSNKVFKTIQSNSIKGSYLVCLPAGASYLFTYQYKDKPSQTLVINAVDLVGYSEKTHDVNFEVAAEILASAKTTSLNARKGKDPNPAIVGFKSGVPVTSTKTTVVEPPLAKTKDKEEPVATASVIAAEPVAVETASTVAKNNKAEATYNFTANPVTSTPLPAMPKPATTGSFAVVNGPQAKSVKYAEKYGSASAKDMEFRVQIAAVRLDKNAPLRNRSILGKVDKLELNDGFTRILVGGKFRTLNEALEHNKKVVNAGQKEGFIIALYQGKRVMFEELERLRLLK
jgi:Tol biopolymer transport system component